MEAGAEVGGLHASSTRGFQKLPFNTLCLPQDSPPAVTPATWLCNPLNCPSKPLYKIEWMALSNTEVLLADLRS